MKDITDAYFSYLLERSNMASLFLYLGRILHDKEFYPLIEMDQNRVQDGRLLREAFLCTLPDASEKDREKLNKPSCSMLELMLGLAVRLNDMYQDSPHEKPVGSWMQELLSNLNLGYMTDKVLTNYPEYIHAAGRILNNLLERTYFPDGKGGLFPLKDPKQDQRKLEIWAQMMAYCNERYPMV